MTDIPGYRIDLLGTVRPDEETYERFFTGRDGTAHLIFAQSKLPRWKRAIGIENLSSRLVFREMLP